MTAPQRRWAGLLLMAALVLGALGGWLWVMQQIKPAAEASHATWAGVDEAVIGKFAQEAGRPEPSFALDWVQGDLLLFAFLCAGLLAGGLLGFYARMLFVEQRDGGRAVTVNDDGDGS